MTEQTILKFEELTQDQEEILVDIISEMASFDNIPLNFPDYEFELDEETLVIVPEFEVADMVFNQIAYKIESMIENLEIYLNSNADQYNKTSRLNKERNIFYEIYYNPYYDWFKKFDTFYMHQILDERKDEIENMKIN